MKRFLRCAALFCFCIFLSCQNTDFSPRAIDGEIDLSSWNLSETNMILLDGEWLFYPEEWVDDRHPASGKPHLVVSRGTWNDQVLFPSSDREGLGWGTYVLKLKLPQRFAFRDYRLNSGLHGVAAKLIVNGEEIGEVGRVSSAFAGRTEWMSFGETIFPLNEIGKNAVLYVQVSNSMHIRGGMWKAPALGERSYMISSSRTDMIRESFAMGGLFLLGLYQLFLYFFRRKNPSSLLFSAFCFVMSLRLTVTGSYVFAIIGNLQDGELPFRLDYLTNYSGAAIAMYYVRSLYPQAVPILWVHCFSSLYILASCFAVFGSLYWLSFTLHPMLVFTFIPLSLSFYILAKIWMADRQGRLILISGMIILMVSIVVDICSTFFSTSWKDSLSFGLLAFVLSQSVYLSRIHSAIVNLAEKELLAAQYQLVQSEKMSSLGIIVAGVAHEINSPMAVIRLAEQNVLYSLKQMLSDLPSFGSILQGKKLSLFEKLLRFADEPKRNLPGIGERTVRKEIEKYLNEIGCPNPSSKAELLVDLGFVSISEDYKEYLTDPECDSVWIKTSEWIGFLRKMEGIHQASDRVTKIIQSLKTFTHLDPKAEKRLSHIQEGIETVLIIFSHPLKFGIEVQKNFDEIPAFLCYPDELIQVWTNLIHNSIQAMETGKGILRISIRQEVSNDISYAVVSVQDTGKGISEKDKKKVFEPFFSTKPAGEGTGLGLHITKQIVEKHDGRIELNSDSSGTKFSVSLPIFLP